MSSEENSGHLLKRTLGRTFYDSCFSASLWGRVADGPISRLVEVYAACNVYYDFKFLKGLKKLTERRLHELSEMYDYSFIHTSKWSIQKDKHVIKALRPSQNDVVLDIGCGIGLRTLKFAEKGATVVGFDLSRIAIKVTKRLAKYFKMDNVHLIVGDVANMGFFRGNKFNKVFCGDVVEHLSDRQKIKLMDGVERSLSEGGLMVLTTPNLFSVAILLLKRNPTIIFNIIERGDLHSIVYQFIKRKNPEHIGLSSIFELQRLLKLNRFSINKIEYYGYWKDRLKDSVFNILEKMPFLRQFLGRRIQITCTKR